MSISLDDVFHTARLARIALNENEARQTLVKLEGIFSLIEQMQAVDTHAVEPMTHPREIVEPLSQRLREDRVMEADRREDFQALAPATEGGLYLVPQVIE